MDFGIDAIKASEHTIAQLFGIGFILFSLCLLLPLGLCGQTISVGATYLSDPYADADTSIIMIGSLTSTTSTLSLVYNYGEAEIEIDPESDFQVEFGNILPCSSGECEATIWIDAEAEELHVSISRAGGFEPFPTEDIVIVRGIDILIDDIHRRKDLESGGMLMFPNPSNGLISLDNSSENFFEQLEVYDLLGNLVHVQTLQQGLRQINLKRISSGRYYLRLKGTDRVIQMLHQINL